jgi:predicted lipoprotein with Yx(FWY)xxD motif
MTVQPASPPRRRRPFALTAALVAVVALAGLITSCGGDESGDATTSTNLNAEGVPEPQPDDTVGSTTPPTEGSGTEVATGESGEGEILFDDQGQALYLYTPDAERPEGTPPTCVDDCATAWPPLLTDGDPVAGPGVDASLLGAVARADGTTQVTYGGQPLYLFASDQPGTTTGQGVGGVWFLVSPSGQAVPPGS